MIHIVLHNAIEVSFFAGIALRFKRLDEYYRKRARSRFKKRLQRFPIYENRLAARHKEEILIQRSYEKYLK